MRNDEIQESLYRYLREKKKYTEAEAEETALRYEAGTEMPKEVLEDVREYQKQFSQKTVL